jgi:hypothetical protein
MAKMCASMMATDFDADLDPGFKFDADSGTAFRKFADPDPQQ